MLNFLLNIWLISLDVSFFMATLYYHESICSLRFKVISATCKSQGVFFYLIHSNQIVTAVNKHLEKQAGIPLYMEEN